MDISLGSHANGESRSESTVTFENRRRVAALGDLRVLPDEILCSIVANLTPRDVARLSCVSSVMYILCNEEPLWMSLCLHIVNRRLEYKGSWKKTAFHQLDLPLVYIEESQKKPLCFDGFTSLFLYQRLYRSYTTLNGFSFDSGNVDRKENISLEEFHEAYDGQKPVLINGLADNWPARKSWTSELLLLRHPDTKFKISQRSSNKITMKFKDYMLYMNAQHDEDPLYIFDEKFGETAPDLLKDYSVPQLFQEDYFDVLDGEQRPPFRWLIIGPERSGASWHVDPSLTSAWNTLLCGRKRWALYPPGRVPLGVTVHVNDEDGDVNIETPTSLQWWLEYYPVLSEHDKPIECTQLPGETIYVPSGWWHCVLNLETTIAVTQNFVNSKNFQFVCLDMAPGYRHKGICRAGLLALHEGGFEDVEKNTIRMVNEDLTGKEKNARMYPIENACNGNDTEGLSMSCSLGNMKYSYDINFLAKFVDKERDHYSSLWSSGNSIGQREMRNWLCKLWVGKPGLRDLIWKGACLALSADKWFERVVEICAFHELPCPVHDEKLPVGTGSNPVYLCADYVIKIFVEGGLETSLYGLGTELEFHNLLQNVNSTLKSYIPTVLSGGILLSENGSYRVLPWDGSCIPEVIESHSISLNLKEVDYPFGVWSKIQFEYQKAQTPSESSSFMWPYIVTKRCRGKIFAELRDTLSSEEALKLAFFLGEQLCNLHLLPRPSPYDSMLTAREGQVQLSCCDGLENTVEWKLFISIINQKRKDVHHRLTAWGDPIPSKLIEKVDDYIPRDLTIFIDIFENAAEASKSCTWIHMDVMDDNIYMTQCCSASISGEIASDSCLAESGVDMSCSSRLSYSWYPSHILDFSDLSVGDPLLDLIPIYLDVFRGDSRLLNHFLNSYRRPFVGEESLKQSLDDSRFGRPSYRAMCYCILHDENILGAIFSLWKELRIANSWEEVEEKVWGELNHYTGSC